MSANSTKEQTLRDQIANLLNTKLTGSGNPAQVVFGYDIANMQDQSPAVIVKQCEIDRKVRYLGDSLAHLWAYFDVETWVRVGDKNSASITNQDAENLLGTLEKNVADFCVDNRRAIGFWDYIGYAKPASKPLAKVVGGSKYRMRTIQLKARVIGG